MTSCTSSAGATAAARRSPSSAPAAPPGRRRTESAQQSATATVMEGETMRKQAKGPTRLLDRPSVWRKGIEYVFVEDEFFPIPRWQYEYRLQREREAKERAHRRWLRSQ